jgi:hypothetical protein
MPQVTLYLHYASADRSAKLAVEDLSMGLFKNPL